MVLSRIKSPPEDWDFKALDKAVFKQFNFHLHAPDDETLENLDGDELVRLVDEAALAAYREKETEIGEADIRNLERYVLLQTIDSMWKDHLLSMDHLKEGIGLRGYAQQNPLLIYKKEGYEMFAEMMDRINEETLGILFRIAIAAPGKLMKCKNPGIRICFFPAVAMPNHRSANRSNEKRKKSEEMPHVPVAAGKNIKNAAVVKR
jgi:preprotein translocase subunit SecA